jgi:hypothetical protein
MSSVEILYQLAFSNKDLSIILFDTELKIRRREVKWEKEFKMWVLFSELWIPLIKSADRTYELPVHCHECNYTDM